MTKNSALAAFRRDVLPHVKETYERDGRVDTPARCEAWNDYVDALQKSGLISQQQASTWTNPF